MLRFLLEASTRVSLTHTIRDTTPNQYVTNMLNSASFVLFPSSTDVKTTNSLKVNIIRSATPGSFPSTSNVKATGMSASRATTKKTQSGSSSQHISRETQHYEGSTPNTGHQSGITFAANDSCGFGYWTSITVKPSGLSTTLLYLQFFLPLEPLRIFIKALNWLMYMFVNKDIMCIYLKLKAYK